MSNGTADWTNIIAAGSSVMTPLLKVPQKHAESKRTLRDYYHGQLAPASDIDLFIHGIEDPEEAIKKMAAIEETVKGNLLWETTYFSPPFFPPLPTSVLIVISPPAPFAPATP